MKETYLFSINMYSIFTAQNYLKSAKMHKNEFNIIFGTTSCKLTTKEYVCQIGKNLNEVTILHFSFCGFFIFKVQLSENK